MEVEPFLIMAVGVDNIFIIVQRYQRLSDKASRRMISNHLKMKLLQTVNLHFSHPRSFGSQIARAARHPNLSYIAQPAMIWLDDYMQAIPCEFYLSSTCG